MRTVVPALFALFCLSACDQGGQYEPHFYERATKTSSHGPFAESWYTRSNTHSRRAYAMVTVNGEPVHFAGSHVQRTAYCEVDGIEAVGLQVRGDNAGYYVVQVVNGEPRTEKICAYNASPPHWTGDLFTPPCKVNWNATNRMLVPWQPSIKAGTTTAKE